MDYKNYSGSQRAGVILNLPVSLLDGYFYTCDNSRNP